MISRPLLLKVFCVWNFLVWGVLIRNMITATDRPMSFRAVHIGIALVSIALAIAVWPRASRRGSSSEEEPRLTSTTSGG